MRFVASIVAGFVTTVVLALGTDFILKTLFPNVSESSLNLQFATLVYTSAFAGVGGFVTARIARVRPLRAVLVLVAIAFCVSLISLASVGSEIPTWYKLASLILLIPCTVAGGWVANRRTYVA